MCPDSLDTVRLVGQVFHRDDAIDAAGLELNLRTGQDICYLPMSAVDDGTYRVSFTALNLREDLGGDNLPAGEWLPERNPLHEHSLFERN